MQNHQQLLASQRTPAPCGFPLPQMTRRRTAHAEVLASLRLALPSESDTWKSDTWHAVNWREAMSVFSRRELAEEICRSFFATPVGAAAKPATSETQKPKAVPSGIMLSQPSVGHALEELASRAGGADAVAALAAVLPRVRKLDDAQLLDNEASERAYRAVRAA